MHRASHAGDVDRYCPLGQRTVRIAARAVRVYRIAPMLQRKISHPEPDYPGPFGSIRAITLPAFCEPGEAA